MKTNRDIISSLDIAKNRKAICRTVFIEEAITKQQIAEGGGLLSPIEREELIKKELKKMGAQENAKNKSQRKILRQKAKSSLIQQTRNEASKNKGHARTADRGQVTPTSTQKEKERTYHEIVIKY